MDEQRFSIAKNKILNKNCQNKGIGTLSEKTMHAILKNYIEPDEEKHEIKVEGYVADIYTNDGIIEVQTAQFNKLRNKLCKFLPLYPVTLVYPIPRVKWLYWIDKDSGETSPKRKSPKTGTPYMIFSELYKIKDYLLDEHLKIKVILLDIEEYRVLNGWSNDKKKGSTRFDRIPISIVEEIDIVHHSDYKLLIPEGLPDLFTTKDYQKTAKVQLKIAQTALRILSHVNAVEKVGKKGNLILYSHAQNFQNRIN